MFGRPSDNKNVAVPLFDDSDNNQLKNKKKGA